MAAQIQKKNLKHLKHVKKAKDQLQQQSTFDHLELEMSAASIPGSLTDITVTHKSQLPVQPDALRASVKPGPKRRAHNFPITRLSQPSVTFSKFTAKQMAKQASFNAAATDDCHYREARALRGASPHDQRTESSVETVDKSLFNVQFGDSYLQKHPLGIIEKQYKRAQANSRESDNVHQVPQYRDPRYLEYPPSFWVQSKLSVSDMVKTGEDDALPKFQDLSPSCLNNTTSVSSHHR